MRKKTKGILVSLTRYAKLVGISRQSVSRAVARGIVTTTQDGRRKLVDPEVASRQRREARLRYGFAEYDPIAEQDFRAARARRLELQAQLMQIEIEVRQGILVNRQRAFDEAEESGRAMCRRLDALIYDIEDVVSAYESASLDRAREVWARAVARAKSDIESLYQSRLRDAGEAVGALSSPGAERLGEAGELASGLAPVRPIEERVFDPGLNSLRAVSILHRTQLREFRLANGEVDGYLPSWPPAD